MKNKLTLLYQLNELAIIEKYYVSHGAIFCQKKLPTRSLNSVRAKARDLGLRRKTSTRWSVAELRILNAGIRAGRTARQISDELFGKNFVRGYAAVKDRSRWARKGL